jgi:hypothetical protein
MPLGEPGQVSDRGPRSQGKVKFLTPGGCARFRCRLGSRGLGVNRLALEMSRNPKTSAAEIFEKLPSSRQKMSSAAAD